MVKVIGVRFRTAGKVYYFDPLEFEIKRGSHVIVETARGVEYGTVVGGIREVTDDEVIQPLKPVIRIATEKDDETEASNKQKEKEAFKICLEKIRKHGLEMKLIDAEYTFDNNKVLFYFTADGRIDFRELVKDLAAVFKTRIELRQIGVRDETKILGGIGICGRPLCCHSYLSDFIPVSIKMAKEQNLSLNPTKISGVCGRLMCCLKNEEDTYEELNRKLPGVGDNVKTPEGLTGEVHSVNVLRQLVKVLIENGDEKELKEYPVDQVTFRRRHGKKEDPELSAEELKELQKLEEEELEEIAENAAAKQEKRNNRQDRNFDKNSDRNSDRNRDKKEQDRFKGDRRNDEKGQGSERNDRRNNDRNKGQKPGKDVKNPAANGNTNQPSEGAQTDGNQSQANGDKPKNKNNHNRNRHRNRNRNNGGNNQDRKEVNHDGGAES
ncbi:MAG: stage 0 sporulation family protein [Lachnospiraceae bacterium]|nr:stage 0 sporulation family protein [Lachnospiraceae bacterium]